MDFAVDVLFLVVCRGVSVEEALHKLDCRDEADLCTNHGTYESGRELKMKRCSNLPLKPQPPRIK
jgi:hypothetical protein